MNQDQTTTDAAILAIPANYRLYTADASIEGQVRAMLALTGQDREDWLAMGESLDAAGRDLRPQLYVSGVGPTLAAAILKACGEINGR